MGSAGGAPAGETGSVKERAALRRALQVRVEETCAAQGITAAFRPDESLRARRGEGGLEALHGTTRDEPAPTGPGGLTLLTLDASSAAATEVASDLHIVGSIDKGGM